MKSQKETNQEWNAMAGDWDDLASSYRNSFCGWLDKENILPSSSSSSQPITVLDFGCGTGLLTEKLRQDHPSATFLCIDAASAMVDAVQSKIRSAEWDNVQAICVSLADYDRGQQLANNLEQWKGTVDVVLASSVLTFIPSSDVPGTMKVLGGLLKPGGLLCHSDWPESSSPDDSKDGDDAKEKAEEEDGIMTEAKAKKYYEHAGLECERIEPSVMFQMGPNQTATVIIGIARKK
uniref:Methyltransferase type 12 domain-containing protein n=1 Tax=Craspedostauros australis TaxID=1486917 RepID=A0A7R9ZSH7_9STRA|mmetsp:Transcript_8503/g.22992  ORF Transcript_8503/g.22992 Transcript_8503/m.22992 type:complete len:235 (+) Transcript_8503:151-855(+)